MAASTRKWDRRGRRGWAIGLTALIAAAGCSPRPPDSVGKTSETRQSALISQTAIFRDGVSGYAGTIDTRIVQNTSSSNFGTSASLIVDGDDPSGTGRDVATLIRWDVSAIPAGSTVQAVTLALAITDASSQSYPVFALRRTWTETGATWSAARSGSAWQSAGAKAANDRDPTALGSLAPTATGPYAVVLNAAGITKVQEWVDAPAMNFGIVIAHAGNTNKLGFSSSETSTVTSRPMLSVTYLLPGTGDGGVATDGAADGAGGAGGVGGTGGSGGASDAGGSGGASDAGGSGGSSDAGAADAPLGGASGSDAGAAGSGQAGSSGGGAGGAGTGGSASVPPVLYAAGDIGDCNSVRDTATGLLLDGTSDPIAVLGDIAYPNGSLGDFANCFDPSWGRHKPRIRPTPGNHEYQMAGALGYFMYFGAPAGMLGMGYYSYDVGGWHVVVINSNCDSVSCSAGSPQEQWLRQDLAANPRACTLAYWHHPRWSSGAHGHNPQMAAIWQALHDNGADLVLNGHDHDYERWAPMDGNGSASPTGMVEIVVGTGGTALRGFPGARPANSVVRGSTAHGVLKLTLRENAYDWEFKPIAGQSFADSGTAACR